MGFFNSLFGRRVVMVWEGTTFRERDRILSQHAGETTLKSDETGHRVEVRLGDGKTGTVVRGLQPESTLDLRPLGRSKLAGSRKAPSRCRRRSIRSAATPSSPVFT